MHENLHVKGRNFDKKEGKVVRIVSVFFIIGDSKYEVETCSVTTELLSISQKKGKRFVHAQAYKYSIELALANRRTHIITYFLLDIKYREQDLSALNEVVAYIQEALRHGDQQNVRIDLPDSKLHDHVKVEDVL